MCEYFLAKTQREIYQFSIKSLSLLIILLYQPIIINLVKCPSYQLILFILIFIFFSKKSQTTLLDSLECFSVDSPSFFPIFLFTFPFFNYFSPLPRYPIFYSYHTLFLHIKSFIAILISNTWQFFLISSWKIIEITLWHPVKFTIPKLSAFDLLKRIRKNIWSVLKEC